MPFSACGARGRSLPLRIRANGLIDATIRPRAVASSRVKRSAPNGLRWYRAANSRRPGGEPGLLQSRGPRGTLSPTLIDRTGGRRTGAHRGDSQSQVSGCNETTANVAGQQRSRFRLLRETPQTRRLIERCAAWTGVTSHRGRAPGQGEWRLSRRSYPASRSRSDKLVHFNELCASTRHPVPSFRQQARGDDHRGG